VLRFPRNRICSIAIFGLLVFGVTARGQDPFEIHVYEYETLKPAQFTLEQHLNYWAKGSKQFDGTVAPTNGQFHMTYEITGGITDYFSLGFMQLNGVRPHGSGLEFAGWRVLPHFYIPKSWHLPIDAGLVTEISFVHEIYAGDSRHIEIRPILERRIGRFQLDFNPVVGRALHGPGTRDGWQFEPAARVAYGDSDSKRVVPYIEWYSELGAFPGFTAASKQVHQLYPGVDLKIRENLLWSVGVGVGLTSIEPRLVYKSRLEFSFGRRKSVP
jgi:hypothetical protein